jgi:hypothetical protein
MKYKLMILSLIASLFLNYNAFAQKSKTEKVTFKVLGNCTQCKERIELACDQKGIKMAEWNIDTKVMTVVYNPSKITLEKIHEYIAAVGHDTELKKAEDKVYKDLPGCCLFRENPNTHHD